MSKLIISENLFLEVNELNRLMKFLTDDGYKQLVKPLIKSFGIVQNESNSNFKVAKVNNNAISIQPGLAFDSNLNAIVSNEILNVSVSYSTIKKWVILSHKFSNLESGKVSLNKQGNLSGEGTEFLEVLRGQPNFPVKVKIHSGVNSGEYEVVKVISRNEAILSGDFVNDGAQVNYSVIGTFTPGFLPDEENKQIYQYDSFNIEILESISKPIINLNQYILSSITFSGSTLNVTDERGNYKFNNSNVQNSNFENETNILASLLSIKSLSKSTSENSPVANFEVLLEHGYTVTNYTFSPGNQNSVFNIVSGNCNFLGSGVITIPDVFKGWVLLNRANMKSAEINGNIGNSLTISNFDTSIFEVENNDFIIIPNFKEIEYEITLSGNLRNPEIPFRYKSSISGIKNRVNFYAYFKDFGVGYDDTISVNIKYRMLDDSGKKYPFNNLAIQQYNDIKGGTPLLVKGTLKINLSDINPI